MGLGRKGEVDEDKNEELRMTRFTGNSVYPAQTPQYTTSNQGLHLFATSNFKTTIIRLMELSFPRGEYVFKMFLN